MERNKNEIWSGAYKALTVGDVLCIDRLNARNDWGISYTTAERLFSEHRKACKRGDIRKMEQVEYRLSDCNFHKECSLLRDGKYNDALAELHRN